jgi:tRNA A37 threonylcarbamoyltransferase TsaD
MRKLALLLVAALLLGGTFALAAGESQRMTEQILGELERDDAKRAITQDLVKRARAATERAAKMRSAGDESHARLADEVAREWAEAARDLARAAEAEAKSAAARNAASDASAQAERERALLEEGIAHNGRLRAEIDQVDRERGTRTAPTPASRTTRDAGADR